MNITNPYLTVAWVMVVFAAVGVSSVLFDAPVAVSLAIYGALLTLALATGVSVMLDPTFNERGAR
ncbi:hypothetical protein [Burkholderia vietnamiensis]|uniref:hypothetical protein n=1 Tax=Burkholderia vietnamiensis TaxID=60552 RepID=UPI001594D1F6|nr:hypothetical protein [Burkholderia vietnamiensis]